MAETIVFETKTIPITAIKYSTFQHADRNREIKSLADSIAANGLINEIIVRRNGSAKTYELVCGERRVRAYIELSRTEIPAKIGELTDQQAQELQVIENLQREGVSILEEAAGVHALLQDGKRTIEDVADCLGKPVKWVARRAKLMDLSPKWLKAIKPGGFYSSWDAQCLALIARYDQKRQDELLEEIQNYARVGDSYKDLREWLDKDMLSLSGAPWLHVDREGELALVPKTPACSKCGKRTSTAPDLFDDSPKAGDRCIDKDCWMRKHEALINLQIAAAQKQDKKLITVCGEGAHLLEYSNPLKKSALNEYQYTKAKAGDKAAVEALVIDGKGAGKLVWVKPSSQAKTEKGAVKTMAERLAALEKRRNIAYLSAVCVLLETEKKTPDLLATAAKSNQVDVMDFVAAFGAESDCDGYANGNTKMKKAMKQIEEFPSGAIIRAAAAIIPKWLRDLRQAMNSTPSADDISFAGLIMDWIGADRQKMLDQVIAEIPEPKSWAALKTDGTPKEEKPVKEKKGKR